MKLFKTEGTALPEKENFIFSEKKVQGAEVGKYGNDLYVRSPRRFKLFTEGTDTICIEEGSGHFKWARGEIGFNAGDAFQAEAVGEYEVNGCCTFFVLRK